MTTDAKPLTKDEFEELEKLEREATPGPWRNLSRAAGDMDEFWQDVFAGEERVASIVDDGDAPLVVVARNALPSLLASARAHASALERAEAAERERDEAHIFATEVREALGDDYAGEEAHWRARSLASIRRVRAERDEAIALIAEAQARQEHAERASASLRERVRALEEGLTTFLDATRFAEDLRRAIPVVDLNAARTRARALLAPAKETVGSLRDAMREIGFRISTIQCGAHQGRYEEGCDTCRGIEVIHHLASGDHREQWTAIHEARDARNRAAAAIHERDEARAERNRLRERFAVDKESGTGLDELIAYVRRRMAEVAAEGGIYDNGFWCVDEAEQAFEVDAESFAEFAGRLEGAEAAAASLRERVRALAEAAGVLADNVVNLRGHYDANPHLASTSVRQGLASLADLAATLRALLAPTKETSREAPLVRCGCGQGWCKECNPAERIAIVERAIQMALDAFGGGPTLNITATQGEALDALRNACSELVVLGYDAAAKTPSRSLTPIGSEPCPSPTKETTTDETDFDGGGSDA